MAGVSDAPAWQPGEVDGPGITRGQPALNPRHVATLLWMRWKLTTRGYRRGGVGSIIGLLFLLAFIVFFVGGAAFGTGVGYARLPRVWSVQLLFAVIAGVYVVWIALPLMQYSLNEGMDVTKLQIYPLTRTEQMVGLVLATLMDVGTLGLVAMYIPILLFWGPTLPALALTVVALALAYVHTVGISQLVLAALMGLLRSRRFRDISIVVFALLGASCSLLGQFTSQLFRGLSRTTVPSLHIDQYLQYTPPGMAARAIELGTQGHYVLALGWLALLAALTPVLLYIWARVLEHGITSAETASSAPQRRLLPAWLRVLWRPARERTDMRAAQPGSLNGRAPAAPMVAGAQAGAAAAGTASRRGILSPAALAIAGKDARYLWRDPQLKASLLSSLVVLVLVILPTFNRGSEASGFLGPINVLYAPIPTLLVALNLSLNSLGLERQALQMLYLFPVRPTAVFWGKNLTIGAVTMAMQVVVAVGLAAFSGGWLYVPVALGAGLAGVLVLMGVGNVTSVLMPFRVREFRTGRTNLSSDNGCLRSVLSMVAFGVAAALLAPVAVALIVPLALSQPLWLAFTLPAAVLYGAALHQLATRLIAPQMLTRAPEILAATTRE